MMRGRQVQVEYLDECGELGPEALELMQEFVGKSKLRMVSEPGVYPQKWESEDGKYRMICTDVILPN